MTIEKWDPIYYLRENDILINSTGTGTVGRTRIFKDSNLENYSFTVPDSHVSVVRLIKFINPLYIFSVISSDIFQQYLENNLAGSTNQKELYIDVIGKMWIPLPGLNEQSSIAQNIEESFMTIDELDDHSIKLSSYIKIAKSKILELAMQGKLVPQDPTEEPAAEMLKRINPKAKIITDNPQCRNIPKSWIACRFGDIAQIARGGSPRPIKSFITENDNGINWIKIGDADGKYINSTKEKIIPEGVSKSRFVRKGDFLLTNSMSFGKPYILNIDGCIHDGWLVISPCDNSYNKDFLYLLLSSEVAFNQFCNIAGGAVVSNLNSDKVSNTILPLPPLKEQKRIVAKIEELYSVLDKIEASLQS